MHKFCGWVCSKMIKDGYSSPCRLFVAVAPVVVVVVFVRVLVNHFTGGYHDRYLFDSCTGAAVGVRECRIGKATASTTSKEGLKNGLKTVLENIYKETIEILLLVYMKTMCKCGLRFESE